MANRKRVNLAKGVAWVSRADTRDGRKGINTLEDGVENMASPCIGFNGPCQLLVLPDHVTGETSYWAVRNLQLVAVTKDGVPIEE